MPLRRAGTVINTVMAGLDPAIHLLGKRFSED
jgi:hypothetical protein